MVIKSIICQNLLAKSLKLKKFYVQLISTNNIDDFSDLVLLTLDCNHEQIDIIHLSSSTPIKGPFIIYKDNVKCYYDLVRYD